MSHIYKHIDDAKIYILRLCEPLPQLYIYIYNSKSHINLKENEWMNLTR